MSNYGRTVAHLKNAFKYNEKQANLIIKRYGTFIGKPKPKNTTIEYYKNICSYIQKDFFGFVKFTRTIKNDYKRDFKTKKRKPKKDSYSEWYNEASMDGSLAYNGVADDF